MMTIHEQIDYLFSKINWGASNLDAKAVEIMNTLKSQIPTEAIIHVKGGIAQWGVADANLELTIIDSDVESMDEDDLTEWTDAFGDTSMGNVYSEGNIGNREVFNNIKNSFDESEEKDVHDN